MAVDEIRTRLRRKLTEAFGEEEAEVLLDQSTDLKLEAMEHRLRAEMAGLRAEIAGEIGGVRGQIADVRSEIATLAGELRGELRDQTWRLTGALLVAMGLVAAILRVG